jgi:hypothetical protein
VTSKQQQKADSAGAVLTAAILADLADNEVAPDSRETELLARASAAADRIELLEAAVAKAGLTYVDKDGIARPSPLLAEIRSTTLVMARCLSGIQMEAGKAAKNPAKVRAGQASWAARSASGDLRGIIPRSG